jgi:hypothetical protein
MYNDEDILDSDDEIVRDVVCASLQLQQFIKDVRVQIQCDNNVKETTHMFIKYINIDLDDRDEVVYFFTVSGMNVHAYSPISFKQGEQEEYSRLKYNYMSPLVMLSCPHYFV